jgi:FtsH-binding integral membrane protein
MHREKRASIIKRFRNALATLTGAAWIIAAKSAYAQTPIFQNPLRFNAVDGVIANIIYWLLGIVAMLALLALIIGGIRMIFGGFGDEQEAKKAKQIMFWAVAGLALVMLSWVIVRYVSYLLGAINVL